jgi:hypothetical protein
MNKALKNKLLAYLSLLRPIVGVAPNAFGHNEALRI